MKDNNGGIQNPNWSNLSALRCFAMGSNKAMNSTNAKNAIAVTVMVLEENKLIQSILRSDSESVRQCLEKVEDNPGMMIWTHIGEHFAFEENLLWFMSIMMLKS